MCLSHLRWNFVFQRPQHLMTRFASERRVFFFEEPQFDAQRPHLKVRRDGEVRVAVPHLPASMQPSSTDDALRDLLHGMCDEWHIDSPVCWYYTPMALNFARALKPGAVIYDCMDELSAFKGAPPELLTLEEELFDHADIVFTGGHSLHEAKRGRHPRVYPFPSSVDVAHFAKARKKTQEPADQASIPHPRLGFFGVIDERMDIDLVGELAASHPEWHLVMLGPVVKIAEESLPKLANIHYLGLKRYEDLPAYLSGWEVALLPFAMNDSTKFISPTKTPEYLAAGCHVVSTPVRDVVRPYGDEGMVAIGSTAAEFGDAVGRALASTDKEWRARVDKYLSTLSWDRTWADMRTLVEDALRKRARAARAETSRRVHLAYKDRRSASRSSGPAAPSMGQADV
ncbi:MAG TPA: glycosyltransferase [Vicinamibacterales bacterium]|nr:glycosyltransferase [Vicinamibacterales bacterium]